VTGSRLTAARRGRELDQLAAGHEVDVLVVGGGITGAGVALDAASRGLDVALVERNDLGSGTSRWSSKLAHGGLRYIAAGQLGVAWESAVERNHLFRRIAPHLVQPMRFVLPVPPTGDRVDRALARVAFGIADGLRAAARTPVQLPRSRWVSGDDARALVPALGADVRHAVVHVDGALEDDLRLVVAVARTAALHGARVVTHCAASDIEARGAVLVDQLTGERCVVRARSVVVAAGVWSGGLVDDVPLRPSKGAHLLLRAEAVGSPTSAFNILVPGTRNRYVFAVPRPDGTVQVGLTDDPVDDISDDPEVSGDDERFLLETLSSGLARPVAHRDVIGRFAGLRPLLGGADGSASADLSRRHALLDRDGVSVIVGGKLTTYRRMAQDTVDRIVRTLGATAECRTTELPLVGAGRCEEGPALPSRLRRRFGSEASEVAACGAVEPLGCEAPALQCEVGWALEAEGAVTAEDVERRLRLDLVPRWRELSRPAIDQLVCALG
jgi:glycerol-3-phosphate dehydrogenase